MRGVCVNRPIGDYFKHGKLKSLVFGHKITHMDEPHYFCYGKDVLGVIKFTNEKEIQADKLQDYYEEHRINDIQRIITWQNYKILWKYKFDIIEYVELKHTHNSSKVAYIIGKVNILDKT